MPTQLDKSVGLKKETTFGTAVTVDHFPEFLSATLKAQPKFVQGQGMRVGSRVARANRRAKVSELAGGDIEVEVATKGFGIFLEAMLGAGLSTSISGAAYQQLFTPSVDDFIGSYTVQQGIPLLGGARQATTFLGAMCSSLEITAGLEEIVKAKTSWIARETKTDIALANPAYPVGAELLTFVHGSIVIGGTVNVPTATALANGGTTAANIRDFSLTLSNGLDSGGMAFGGGGKLTRRKALGALDIKGKITAEYTDNVLRDAWLAQTDLALVMSFISTNQIGVTGAYPALQIVVPNIRLDGDVPVASNSDVQTLPIDFTGLDGQVAAAPIYIVYRTTDTAI